MINSMYFSKEQFENGEMGDFINQLNKLSYGNGDQQVQILIKPADCGAYTVEFIQVPWDESYGGSFQYVDDEHTVMFTKSFPDGTEGIFFNENDYLDQLKIFLEENPNYTQNEYGIWHASEEQYVIKDSNVNMFDGDLYHENGVPQQ